MCGISAFIATSNHSEHVTWLVHSGDTLRHRGPDDIGFFYNSSSTVGLAHTRLSIQDTSKLGSQPFYSQDKSIVIVFNGEIYNFKDIRLQLLRDGYSFVGNSDTEVLLNLYLSIKSTNSKVSKVDIAKTFLGRLNGIFSFVIWDSQLDSIFVARDHFGVKPLYYQVRSNSLYFSSEIKSFDLSRSELDFESIDRYLHFSDLRI